MATNQNSYNLLGVKPNATRKEINTAYKKASLKAHPNKPGGSKNAFQKLGQAYNTVLRILESRNSGNGQGQGQEQASHVKLLEDEIAALTEKENEINDAVGKTHWKEWVSYYTTQLRTAVENESFLGYFQDYNNKSSEILRSVKTLYSSPISQELKEKIYAALGQAWQQSNYPSDSAILQKISEVQELEKQQALNNFKHKQAMLIRILRDNKELLQKEKTELYNEYIKSDEYLGIVTEQQITERISAKKEAIIQALTPKPRRNNTSGVPYLRAYNVNAPLDKRARELEKENATNFAELKGKLDKINADFKVAKLPEGYYLPYNILKTYDENKEDWYDFNSFIGQSFERGLVLTTLYFKITNEKKLTEKQPKQPKQPDTLYKMYIGVYGGARRDDYSDINFYKDEPYFTSYVIKGLPKLIDAIAAVTAESRPEIIRKLQENNPGLPPLSEPVNNNNAFGGSRKSKRSKRAIRATRAIRRN